MWKLKVAPDATIFTSLIQLCNRCDDLNRAFEVLQLMMLFNVKPDAFVYTSLIDASAKVRSHTRHKRSVSVMCVHSPSGVRQAIPSEHRRQWR
jgi:pentatricopeptide repeat protein